MNKVYEVSDQSSLVERIAALKSLMEFEKQSTNDERYISDLELSIKRCEKGLK